MLYQVEVSLHDNRTGKKEEKRRAGLWIVYNDCSMFITKDGKGQIHIYKAAGAVFHKQRHLHDKNLSQSFLEAALNACLYNDGNFIEGDGDPKERLAEYVSLMLNF